MMPTAPTQELVHSLSASASRKNIIYLLRIDYPATFDRIPSLSKTETNVVNLVIKMDHIHVASSRCWGIESQSLLLGDVSLVGDGCVLVG